MDKKPKSINALLLPIGEKFEVYGDNVRWKAQTIQEIVFDGVDVI